MKTTKDMLTAKFKRKDLGKLKCFLGIDIEQSNECVKMSKRKYVEKLLVRFNMLNYSVRAHVLSDVQKYREAVGSLIDLTTCTRADLSFVVSRLSQQTLPTLQKSNGLLLNMYSDI